MAIHTDTAHANNSMHHLEVYVIYFSGNCSLLLWKKNANRIGLLFIIDTVVDLLFILQHEDLQSQPRNAMQD
jgi:hypothetical protein